MLTNPRDASVKVTEHGTIRYVMYGFLLVFYIKFVPKTHRFEIFDFEKCRDLEIRPKVTQGYRNRHGSIRHL